MRNGEERPLLRWTQQITRYKHEYVFGRLNQQSKKTAEFPYRFPQLEDAPLNNTID